MELAGDCVRCPCRVDPLGRRPPIAAAGVGAAVQAPGFPADGAFGVISVLEKIKQNTVNVGFDLGVVGLVGVQHRADDFAVVVDDIAGPKSAKFGIELIHAKSPVEETHRSEKPFGADDRDAKLGSLGVMVISVFDPLDFPSGGSIFWLTENPVSLNFPPDLLRRAPINLRRCHSAQPEFAVVLAAHALTET